MKKNTHLLSSFFLILSLPVSAVNFSVGNLQYTTIDDGNSVEVSGYKNQPTEITFANIFKEQYTKQRL